MKNCNKSRKYMGVLAVMFALCMLFVVTGASAAENVGRAVQNDNDSQDSGTVDFFGQRDLC